MSTKLIEVDPSDLTCGTSLLRQRSRNVEESDDIGAIITKLRHVLHGTPHAHGIAAIQIGIPLRLAIVNVSRVASTEIILINPSNQLITGRAILRLEGCMSLPDHHGPVRRRNKVSLRSCTIDGPETWISAKGYVAAVIQHELDHMDGCLYWDRIELGSTPIERPKHDRK